MNIIEKSRELGLALAESREFKELTEARIAVSEDQGLINLYSEYHLKEQILVSTVSSPENNKEAAVLMTADLDRLKGLLAENANFSRLMNCQNAFAKLLADVNEEINSCIGMPEDRISAMQESSCSGSCESCGKCTH